MEPLNKKERKKAFWRFLTFFLVTVILVVAAVFINFQIPLKENRLLRAKHEKMNRELEFQTGFTKNMHEVEEILDSINHRGQNVMYLEQLVSNKLAGMKESIPGDDSLRQRKMYDAIIQALLALQDSKRHLREHEESRTLLAEYEQNIEHYREALDQAKRDLDICRQLSSVQ